MSYSQEEIEEIYDSFYNPNAIELEDYKSKMIKNEVYLFGFLIFAFPVMAVIYIIAQFYQLIASILSIILLIYFYKKFPKMKNAMNDYFNLYLERVYKKVIEEVFENSIYTHKYGISEKLYKDMCFQTDYDYFETDGCIRFNTNPNLIIFRLHTMFYNFGNNNNIKDPLLLNRGLKSIYTNPLKRRRTKNDFSTLFCGLVSIKTLDFNIPFYIKIRNKNSNSLKLDFATEVFNDVFNEYYEIQTDNPKLLNKYLTNSIILKLIDLATNKTNIEINISSNHIYTRLHSNFFTDFNTENDKQKVIDRCKDIESLIHLNNFLTDEFNNIIHSY